MQVAFAASKKPRDKKPAHESKALASRIEKILSQPDVARAFWGIEAVDVATGETLYTQNADKLFTPASNTKLFTTSAVLALIGPDYKFRTTVETTGSLDKYGRLSGDVVVVGRGDPNLTGGTLAYNLRSERNATRARVLEQLADQLVQRGVKFVDGDVVGDDSYFAFERYGEGWSQEDMRYEWGAPVSALTINDNLILVNVMPGDHSGDKAFINVTPFRRLLPLRQPHHDHAGGHRAAQRDHRARAGIEHADAVGQHPGGRSRLSRVAGHRRSGRIHRPVVPHHAGAARDRGLRTHARQAPGTGEPVHVQRYRDRIGRWRRYSAHHAARRFPGWCWANSSRSRWFPICG